MTKNVKDNRHYFLTKCSQYLKTILRNSLYLILFIYFKKMDLQKDQKEQPVFALDCGAL